VSRQFRVRNPQVVDDTIEGEVIVIDLDSGSYYSLRDISAEIWHCVKAGADEDSIGDSLAERYAASSEEIASSVSRLLDELAAERLIEEAAEGAATAEPLPAPLAQNGRVPFIAPVLEKHTDMQDLILLDPVHDVTEAGWPHVASTGDKA
jgi:Coenzyme PQQ synthesis protein D (PqqD)